MRFYQNPIKKHGDGDLADPFVLRYNGKYYLYCTNPLIQCWSSFDLCHWQPEGPVIDENEFPGLVPFAPEVVYWNGAFYMYTSPHGLGHYVLKSDSPTGPFHKITGNIGHSIDLSIFIDDDGSWYAYWADWRGIVGCRMKSPTEFGEEVLVGASMHGWTEGPFVVKRAGKYHLTYTGNHYLSKGYRINMAVADHPLGPFADHAYNPLIVRTQGEVTGLGHSSTVLGPDLCTDYIVYHNINPDTTRDMNIDAILLHPEGAYLLGPTAQPRPAPALPLWSDRLEAPQAPGWQVQRGSWALAGETRCAEGDFRAVCQTALPRAGAVEFHLAAGAKTQRYGLLFQGEADCTLTLDRAEGRITLALPDGETLGRPLWDGFDHRALHAIRVEYGQTGAAVYLDGLLALHAGCLLGSLHAGCFADNGLLVGRTAIAERGTARLAHPVPALLPAHDESAIEVTEPGVYQICCVAEPAPAGCIWLDGQPLRGGGSGGASAVLRAELTPGIHTLASEGLSAACLRVEKLAADPIPAAAVEDFGPYDKVCGQERCSDLLLHAALTVEPAGEGWQAGVLLRAQELADGGEGADKVLGTDFFIGYRVCLAQNALQLWKHRYDAHLLAEYALPDGKEAEFQVALNREEIKVFLGGRCVLRWQDPAPILSGSYGFHARNCIIRCGSLYPVPGQLEAD